jgi:hypothetical protein
MGCPQSEFNLSGSSETILQLRVSESLKRRIAVKAFENEQTLRCFVLHALKDAGVVVDDCDLTDRRKNKAGGSSNA